jgi:hypothetical protein
LAFASKSLQTNDPTQLPAIPRHERATVRPLIAVVINTQPLERAPVRSFGLRPVSRWPPPAPSRVYPECCQPGATPCLKAVTLGGIGVLVAMPIPFPQYQSFGYSKRKNTLQEAKWVAGVFESCARALCCVFWPISTSFSTFYACAPSTNPSFPD